MDTQAALKLLNLIFPHLAFSNSCLFYRIYPTAFADHECMVSFQSNACIRFDQMGAFVSTKCMQLYVTNEWLRVKRKGWKGA